MTLPPPPKPRPGRGRPPGTIWDKITSDEVHRWLWTLRDDRNRIVAPTLLARKRYGSWNNGPTLLVSKLAKEGRMRLVKIGQGRAQTFEVTDPDVYDPTDPSTHTRRHQRPAWG